VVRLRTEESDLNGLRAGEPIVRIEDLFQGGRWVAIDLDIRPRELAVAIDGERALVAELPESVLATWHPFLSFALGNEMTCDRPWLGEIRAAVIEGREGSTDYARLEDVHVPTTCWVISYPPAIRLFRLFLPHDAVLNRHIVRRPLGTPPRASDRCGCDPCAWR
jgi:hypothetical protein